MRIESIELGRWKAFPATVQLDLASLPGVVTAISGPNGAGKTTLCTLGILGALYRRIPGQSANDLAAARDTYVTAPVHVGGQRLTITQTFDPRGGGAVLVKGPDGEPIDACRTGGI